MSEQPFFSIVIPLYNKAPHVARSIDSALKQSFQDFELIVVNDASTDSSEEEVLKFEDDRIRLFCRNHPGAGGYAARNLGIKVAYGKWVAFLDADDAWHPEHLEKMYKLSFLFPEVYFMGSGWHFQTKDTKIEDAYYKHHRELGPHEINAKDYFKSSLSKKPPVWTSVACVNKLSLKIVDLFPDELKARRGGDLNAWLKLICYHKKMAWSNHVGAIYFKDSINMVTKNANPSPALLTRAVCQELSEHLDIEETRLLKKYFNRRLGRMLLRNSLINKKFHLINILYYKGDIIFALFMALMSFLPPVVYRSLYFIGVKLRGNSKH